MRPLDAKSGARSVNFPPRRPTGTVLGGALVPCALASPANVDTSASALSARQLILLKCDTYSSFDCGDDCYLQTDRITPAATKETRLYIELMSHSCLGLPEKTAVA